MFTTSSLALLLHLDLWKQIWAPHFTKSSLDLFYTFIYHLIQFHITLSFNPFLMLSPIYSFLTYLSQYLIFHCVYCFMDSLHLAIFWTMWMLGFCRNFVKVFLKMSSNEHWPHHIPEYSLYPTSPNLFGMPSNILTFLCLMYQRCLCDEQWSNYPCIQYFFQKNPYT